MLPNVLPSVYIYNVCVVFVCVLLTYLAFYLPLYILNTTTLIHTLTHHYFRNKTYQDLTAFSEKPYDKSGVLYYIGTGGSTAPYKNPHLTGQVTASMSSLFKVCIVYVCDCVSGGGCVCVGGGGVCVCVIACMCACVYWFVSLR